MQACVHVCVSGVFTAMIRLSSCLIVFYIDIIYVYVHSYIPVVRNILGSYPICYCYTCLLIPYVFRWNSSMNFVLCFHTQTLKNYFCILYQYLVSYTCSDIIIVMDLYYYRSIWTG
jgi:hypothetical protein